MNKAILTVVIVAAVLVAGYFIYASMSGTFTTGNKITEIQGMKIETISKGSGAAAQDGDTVTVNYIGTLENGTKFDSSVDRGVPFSFTLGAGQVIRGWDLGVVGMKVGEKRKLTIPADLAYGDASVGSAIPPRSTLVFEVEMLKITSK